MAIRVLTYMNYKTLGKQPTVLMLPLPASPLSALIRYCYVAAQLFMASFRVSGHYKHCPNAA